MLPKGFLDVFKIILFVKKVEGALKTEISLESLTSI